MSHDGPDEDPRQEFGPSRLPALLGGRHCLPGQADLRTLGGGPLQEVGQRPGQGRLHLEVDHLQGQSGVAAHGVVQAGRRVELLFPCQDQGLAALGQLHLGAQHVLFEGDASLAPGLRVLQDRLGPADGVFLHPAGRASKKDVQVSGGHVELHGLVGPNELEFRDAFARDRLAITAAGPPEVIHGPLQRLLRFPRSHGCPVPFGRMNPSFPGTPGASVEETTPYCPSRSICGKKGAKAACSWPRARSMPARADRSRGLFRRAKAMASVNAKVVSSGSGSRLAEESRGVWSEAPGLTTVSAGLTFRSGGTRTRAATPSWVTSGGMGKGERQEAQPATSIRGISTRTQPNSRGTTAGKVEGHGKATSRHTESPLGGAAPGRDEIPVRAATPTIQTI